MEQSTLFKKFDRIIHKKTKKLWYIKYLLYNYMILEENKYGGGDSSLVFKKEFDEYELTLKNKLKQL